ncbi:MAG: porin family protein [Planctomycetes bacterium]|nr:porin family protein [Planctomycetota bacterium]
MKFKSIAASDRPAVEKSSRSSLGDYATTTAANDSVPDAPAGAPGEPNWLEPKLPAPTESISKPAPQPQVSLAPPPQTVYTEEPGAMGQGSNPFHRLFIRLDELGVFGPPPQGRYRPWGTPLQHTSWQSRKFSFAFMGGEFFPGNPMGSRITGQPGYIGSFRFGWDFEHYWGLEVRLGTASTGLRDSVSTNPPSDMKMFLADMNLMYYPWGDTRWRPYATAGLGLATVAYGSDAANVNATAGAMPFGFGVKYRHNERWILRAEFLDHYTFQSSFGANQMNNLTLTAGIEYRLGIASRRSYWPWNPSHVPF